MFAPAARHQAEEARQLDAASRGAEYRAAPVATAVTPRARRLSHRKVLCFYIPLCMAALATVILSLFAATTPMTVTNTESTRLSSPFYSILDMPMRTAAEACCEGRCYLTASDYISSGRYRASTLSYLSNEDIVAFDIGYPYDMTNCTLYTRNEFIAQQMHAPFFDFTYYHSRVYDHELVAVVERNSKVDLPYTTTQIILFAPGGNESSQTYTFSYVNLEYETYNTFIKPRNINRRHVVTSPISTWHSLAELTTMIALAISGCLFAFAWSQVKELDAMHELEQTTSNAVVLTEADQYSVLGTAFGDSEELVENPYGTSLYTKTTNRGDGEDNGGYMPNSRMHSHANMGHFSDEGSDHDSAKEGQDSLLSSPNQPCRPPSPHEAAVLPPASVPDREAAALPNTVGVRITMDGTEAEPLTIDAQQDGREAAESSSNTGVLTHEPSSPTPVRAIPISRTRITRMRRLRDMIRQYQLARVRQLALLDCVLLIMSFFLFINTFARSSEESATEINYRLQRTITAQHTYVGLRIWCCVLSVFTFLVTALIVRFDIW